MRKYMLILGLAVASVLATYSDASAQIRFGGRNGVTIGGGGGYNNYGNRGYYGGGRGYDGFGYGNRGYNFGNQGFYSGSGYQYPLGQSYYNSSPSYYYSTPSYSSAPTYYSDSAVQVVPAESRQSFYTDPNVANITVLVPAADAEVWFDSATTSQRGMERSFQTPSLEPGNYTYTIRARWNENGKSMDQQRQVRLQPGQSVTADFRTSNENLNSPKTTTQP